MQVLNLGCGTKVSPDVVNIDWSPYLRIRRSRVLSSIARLLLSEERRKKLDSLPSSIICCDLTEGIPFPDNTIDAVYHSHLFEHLERNRAERFIAEVKRVLKPRGIHRIVVPDLEQLTRRYLSHLDSCASKAERDRHDSYVADIIEQLVREQGTGASRQSPFVMLIERMFVGSARRRGEAHRWMWDLMSLTALLEKNGFIEITRCGFDASGIHSWDSLRLDHGPDGSEYLPGSLYVEAQKPARDGV